MRLPRVCDSLCARLACSQMKTVIHRKLSKNSLAEISEFSTEFSNLNLIVESAEFLTLKNCCCSWKNLGKLLEIQVSSIHGGEIRGCGGFPEV